MLTKLRDRFDETDGPRAKALAQQNKYGTRTTDRMVVPSLQLYTNCRERIWATTSFCITAPLLQTIILHCVEQTLVRTATGRWVKLRSDIFGTISTWRSVNKTFYFAILDMWPRLQQEMFTQIEKMFTPGCNALRNHVTVTKFMDTLDPQLARSALNNEIDTTLAARNFLPVIRERLWRFLKLQSCQYLIIMATNDKTLGGVDITGIPTLSGFAYFLDINFGDRIACLVKKDRYKDAIALFFVKEAPCWNMLTVSNSKSLENYLFTTSKLLEPAKHSELVWHRLSCAAPAIFCDDLWHPVQECITGNESPPPVRSVSITLANTSVCYTVMAEIILPIRRLRKRYFESSCEEHEHCFTMNITSGMLLEATHVLARGTSAFTPPSGSLILPPESLNDMDTLQENLQQNLNTWSEILLTKEADRYRAKLFKLDVFQNSKSVFDAISKTVGGHQFVSYVCINNDRASEWTACPLSDDWTEQTVWKLDDERRCYTISVAESLRKDLDRTPWAPNSFFDLRDDYVNLDGLSKLSVCAGDPTDLMSHINLSWYRHTFPTAGKIGNVHAPKVCESKQQKRKRHNSKKSVRTSV